MLYSEVVMLWTHERTGEVIWNLVIVLLYYLMLMSEGRADSMYCIYMVCCDLIEGKGGVCPLRRLFYGYTVTYVYV